MRCIHTVANKVGEDLYQAKVYYSKDWEEYQVRLTVNGNVVQAATYHTDWEDDAIGTARTMCHLPPKP
jgi:hypothetical protein